MKFAHCVAAAALASVLAACGGREAAPETDTTAAVDTTMATTGITIEPKAPGADFPDARLAAVSYENGNFIYTVPAGDYALGAQTPDAGATMCANSGQGQHVHLIVDNEPYIASYEPTIKHEMLDGEHYILNFLSRSYHESLKHEGAAQAVLATVGNNAFTSAKPITEPMLFYSRPKGDYVGKDAENILLDFYPVNAPLGGDYKVRVDIGDFSTTLDTWQPYVIKGLPMGQNTVTLTLVDGSGATVDAPLNPVSRNFNLYADPLPAQ